MNIALLVYLSIILVITFLVFVAKVELPGTIDKSRLPRSRTKSRSRE